MTKLLFGCKDTKNQTNREMYFTLFLVFFAFTSQNFVLFCGFTSQNFLGFCNNSCGQCTAPPVLLEEVRTPIRTKHTAIQAIGIANANINRVRIAPSP